MTETQYGTFVRLLDELNRKHDDLNRKQDAFGEQLKEHDQRTQRLYGRVGELAGEVRTSGQSLEHLRQTVDLRMNAHASDIRELKGKIQGVEDTTRNEAITAARADAVLVASRTARVGDLSTKSKKKLVAVVAAITSAAIAVAEIIRLIGGGQ